MSLFHEDNIAEKYAISLSGFNQTTFVVSLLGRHTIHFSEELHKSEKHMKEGSRYIKCQ